MATSKRKYAELLQAVEELDTPDQIRLLERLAALARNGMAGRGQRSILELEGLGKEIWDGVDAQAYVDKERAAWNG